MFLLLEDDLLPASDNVTLMRRRLRRAAHDLTEWEAQGVRAGREENAEEGPPDLVYLEFCYESCKPSRPGRSRGGWGFNVDGGREGEGEEWEGGRGKLGYTPARYPSCTAAVLYSRRGAQRILEAARPVFDAYDQMLPRLIADGTVRAALATPPLFYQDGLWAPEPSSPRASRPSGAEQEWEDRVREEEEEGGGVRKRGDGMSRCASRHATKHVMRHHVLKPSCAIMRPAMLYLQNYFLIGQREYDAEGQHPSLHLKDFFDFVTTFAGTAAAAALDSDSQSHSSSLSHSAADDDPADQGDGRVLMSASVRLEVYMQSIHDSIYDEEEVSRGFTVHLGQLWW